MIVVDKSIRGLWTGVAGSQYLGALLGVVLAVITLGEARAANGVLLSVPVQVQGGQITTANEVGVSYRLVLRVGKHSNLTLVPAVKRHAFAAHVMFSDSVGTPTLGSDKAMVENSIPWSEFENTATFGSVLDGLKGATDVVSLERGKVTTLGLLLKLIGHYRMIKFSVNTNSVKRDILSQQSFVDAHSVYVLIQQEASSMNVRWFTLQSLYNEVRSLSEKLAEVVDLDEVSDLLSQMVEDSPNSLAHTFEERHVNVIEEFVQERSSSCRASLSGASG